jgi:hypothetical protein
MATATATTEVTGVILELSRTEAEWLKSLLGNAASDEAYEIYGALRDAGIRQTGNPSTSEYGVFIVTPFGE